MTDFKALASAHVKSVKVSNEFSLVREKEKSYLAGFRATLECVEVKAMREALERAERALDALYNHNAAVQTAVVSYYGLHHSNSGQTCANFDKLKAMAVGK